MRKSIITAYGKLTIPSHIEKAIVTPHDHEGENHRPLWILWKHEICDDRLSDGPQIESICDSESSIRYHVIMMLERIERIHRSNWDKNELLIHVERVPANHNFGHNDLKSYYEFVDAGKNRVNMKQFRHNKES